MYGYIEASGPRCIYRMCVCMDVFMYVGLMRMWRG